MANPQPQDTNVATMSDFVEKYGKGTDEILEQLDEKENAAPKATPSSGSPPFADPPDGSDDDEESLDAATLQALGLISEEERAQISSDDDDAEEGTTESMVDPAALAQVLGLSENDLIADANGVRIKTKVDGQETVVSPEELRKGYQLQKHFTAQNEEFLRQRQAWEQARQAQEAQLAQQGAVAMEVLRGEEEGLKAKYTKDWQSLRQDDPAEYAAQVAEYNQELQKIRGRQQGVMASLQQQEAERQQAFAQQQQQLRAQGAQALAQELSWKTQEEYQKGSQALRSYLQSAVGLHPQEIEGILDPRVLVLTDKARRYDELLSKADLVKKKVRQTHTVPSGVASKPAGGSRRKLDVAKARLAKSGSIDDAAALFSNMKGIV